MERLKEKFFVVCLYCEHLFDDLLSDCRSPWRVLASDRVYWVTTVIGARFDAVYRLRSPCVSRILNLPRLEYVMRTIIFGTRERIELKIMQVGDYQMKMMVESLIRAQHVSFLPHARPLEEMMSEYERKLKNEH
jgi:hypothetical protein